MKRFKNTFLRYATSCLILLAGNSWAFDSKPILVFWLSSHFVKTNEVEQLPKEYAVKKVSNQRILRGLIDSLQVIDSSQSQPMSIFIVNKMVNTLQKNNNLPWREVAFILDADFSEIDKQRIVKMGLGLGYNHVVMYLNPNCQSLYVTHYYLNDSYHFPHDATWSIVEEVQTLSQHHGICNKAAQHTEYHCKPYMEGCVIR